MQILLGTLAAALLFVACGSSEPEQTPTPATTSTATSTAHTLAHTNRHAPEFGWGLIGVGVAVGRGDDMCERIGGAFPYLTQITHSDLWSAEWDEFANMPPAVCASYAGWKIEYGAPNTSDDWIIVAAAMKLFAEDAMGKIPDLSDAQLRTTIENRARGVVP